MMVIHKLMSFLIVVQFLCTCTTSKETYFSYRVGTYTIDTVKRLIYYDHLISYGDYLFEFKDLVKINRTVYGNSDSTSINYDTIGVYLLSGNKLYYEFDTFALKNKVVKVGKITDKESGSKFKFSAKDSTSNLLFSTPKKIVINNIDCFITEIIPKNKTDTTNQKILLFKNEKFNSFYKINGIKYPDSNYCIVGFHIYDLKNKQGFLQEIEFLKPLTEKEKEICANMVTKSKSCVVYTIKSL